MMQNQPETISPQPTLTIVKRLDDCWARYRAELKRVRSEFAEEYVHDLRVAIRRLIAVVDMGRVVTGQKKIKKSQSLLKSHLDAFDHLRDTQVQLVIAEEIQSELPEIAVYIARLREREKKQSQHLEKRIKDFHSSRVSHQVARLTDVLLAQNTPEAQTAIWAAVDAAYARVVQRQRAVLPEDTTTIHRMRLAFKKFRYRVELVYDLLPNAPEDLLRRLHDYQSAMGEIQDAEVGLQMLNEFMIRSHAEIPSVHARFVEMHQARIAAFLEQANDLQGFWRETPEQPFPWEI